MSEAAIVEPIVQIGLFHLAEKHCDPFGSLTGALAKHANLARTLLVLPEAFNRGDIYYDDPQLAPPITADETLKFLENVARKHDLIIVVSVLESRENRAYLVDKNGPHPMGRKSVSVDSG